MFRREKLFAFVNWWTIYFHAEAIASLWNNLLKIFRKHINLVSTIYITQFWSKWYNVLREVLDIIDPKHTKMIWDTVGIWFTLLISDRRPSQIICLLHFDGICQILVGFRTYRLDVNVTSCYCCHYFVIKTLYTQYTYILLCARCCFDCLPTVMRKEPYDKKPSSLKMD